MFTVQFISTEKSVWDCLLFTGKLLGKDNFPLKIPANQEAVIGPDNKPVYYANGKPVFVPAGNANTQRPQGLSMTRALCAVPVLGWSHVRALRETIRWLKTELIHVATLNRKTQPPEIAVYD